MASPISVSKNNYFENPKSNDIQTPEWLSEWLYRVIVESGMKTDIILDPAIGLGSLTKHFKDNGSYIIGIDIEEASAPFANTFIHGKFEDIVEWTEPVPDLIIVNPPFNQASGRKLYPEVFLRQIDKLFGTAIPILMIAPMGMRLNQGLRSSRWRYMRDNWRINSIISLPYDMFEKEDGSAVMFHAEIVCFNVLGMSSHYFVADEAIPLDKLVKKAKA